MHAPERLHPITAQWQALILWRRLAAEPCHGQPAIPLAMSDLSPRAVGAARDHLHPLRAGLQMSQHRCVGGGGRTDGQRRFGRIEAGRQRAIGGQRGPGTGQACEKSAQIHGMGSKAKGR